MKKQVKLMFSSEWTDYLPCYKFSPLSLSSKRRKPFSCRVLIHVMYLNFHKALLHDFPYFLRYILCPRGIEYKQTPELLFSESSNSYWTSINGKPGNSVFFFVFFYVLNENIICSRFGKNLETIEPPPSLVFSGRNPFRLPEG